MMKMTRTDWQMLIMALVFLMSGCQSSQQTAVAPAPSPTVAITSTPAPMVLTNDLIRPIDKWLGQWNGVEGTYLSLAKKGDNYIVKIADLDGPKTYDGVAAGDHIEFKRSGKTETIRATNGEGTGMKWLLREKTCLVVTVGSEGFCRK